MLAASSGACFEQPRVVGRTLGRRLLSVRGRQASALRRLTCCPAPPRPPLFQCCSKMVTASDSHKNLIRGCLPYAKIK